MAKNISVTDVKLHPYTVAYGAIEGIVETLTARRDLRFLLYDQLHDKAVSCYLREDQREEMRSVWGHRAIIRGKITRDGVSGRPLAIREISEIKKLSWEPGQYRYARGAVPVPADAEASEDTIRRLRDAWSS